jgi:serine/threonine protein kinase
MPEIGQTLSHFKIVEKIGEGGMGTVFLADDTTLDRKVALKFLPDAFTSDPERMARFEREAKLLASLNHPNIAGIYGLEQADGNRFLVLEYVEGETLQARVSKGALPLEEALELCRQIAEGLEAAHEKGVIHRDLKPANVMITAEDKVKILDFGLAKAFSDDTEIIDSSQSPTLTEAMTRPGVILGTAAYMSPEQAKGKSVDKRADIWAFGCILYECLTGKKAFEGETVTEMLAAILRGEPDWNTLHSATPRNIRFVLRRCLEKERNRRFRDAADVQIEIEEARDSGESAATTVKPRKLWIAWGVAAALVLALAIALWALWREKTVDAELMKFQIQYPEKAIPGEIGKFALSPDGRYLAFSAREADNLSRIWIRELSSLEARPLPGSESKGSSPFFFWSPDSRFIAFDAGGELKKIDVAEGPSRPICKLSEGAIGGSWNREDVIIFGELGRSGGIMQVSAAGGIPSPVTIPNLERGEQFHVLPTFLSDGRHFIYYRRTDIHEYAGIYIGSLDSKPEDQDDIRLMASSCAAAYVPPMDSKPGLLLFLIEKTLMAQQFDDKKLKPIGDPVPITDQVGSYMNTGFFSASSNGKLAYRSRNIQLFQLTWFDRQRNPLGTVGEPGRFGGLAISPDGKSAAISTDKSTNDTAFPNIWLHDFAQGRDMPVTSDMGREINPVWSADGSRIIFRADIDGNIYQVPVGGIRSSELLLESDLRKQPNSCSANGQYLLYTVTDPETREDLWIYTIDKSGSETPFIATQDNEYNGRFSPDRRYVAYVSDKTGNDEIYICEFSPDSLDKFSETTGSRRISRGGGIEPRWSGDSKELYYRASDGMLMVVEITAGTTFQPSTPEPLFQTPPYVPVLGASPYPWDVTSDGRRFLLPVPMAESSPSPFNVILNWERLLEQ